MGIFRRVPDSQSDWNLQSVLKSEPIQILKPASQEELKSKGKIEFDITPPTAEERDKILRDMKK